MDSDVDVIADSLSSAVLDISEQAAAVGMSLSATKSTTTYFTPWRSQFNRLPPISVNGAVIPAERNPRLLGVVFDPLFTFSSHAIATARRASSRLNVLRALADTSFGKDKECLLATFKSLIRPIIDYAAPIIYPNLSPTSLLRLQRVQNRGLRLVLGCHSASSVDHLHVESQILPVEKHLRLLSSQYLARALQTHHPSYEFAVLGQGPRNMKQTLRSKCFADVEPFLVDGAIRAQDFKGVIDSIHTKIVGETVDLFTPNRTLNTKGLFK